MSRADCWTIWDATKVLCDLEYTWRDIMTGKMGGCYLRLQLFLLSIFLGNLAKHGSRN